MLSYQHGYHAGNFADVIKHSALCCLLNYLTQKEKPFFYLETHSGKGLYDLKDKQAEKTSEYKQGIELIWTNKKKLPSVFKSYIELLNNLNKQKDSIRNYAGSPYLAIHLMRIIDRLYLCELHPNEYEALTNLSRLGKKVHVSNEDGVIALTALLPPMEKRGLIFIDPAYELKEEYKTIPLALKKAYSRFNNGVYCLWYPLLNQRNTDQFIKRLHNVEAKKALRIEFHLNDTTQLGMVGCGLWVINPPFTFATEIKLILDTLKNYFNPGKSTYTIE